MRTLVETLFAAQGTLLRQSPNSPSCRATLQTLQQRVPAPILAHFLRLVAQQRKGVAEVRHGVCSECHLRIPSSVVAALQKPKELSLCENCGCYLLLDSAELAGSDTPFAPTHPIARKVGRPRRALAV